MRIALLLGVLVLADSALAAEVRLRAAATCSSSVVRLADVAEIAADDAALAAALGAIPLCPAPGAGDERLLTQHEIRQLLAVSGVARTDVLVTGSEQVALTAGASAVPARNPREQSIVGVRQALFEPTAKKTQPQRLPAAAAKPVAAPLKLVERGGDVNVYARTKGVSVAQSGKALAAGALGESILIEIEGSKEKLLARVVAPQTVEVAVPGRNQEAK